MAMDHITLNQGMSTNEVIIRLNNLRRWTEITSQGKYNELAKQALNCVIVYLLAKFAEHEGKSIRYEDFPRIALGRAYARYMYILIHLSIKSMKSAERAESTKGNLIGLPTKSLSKKPITILPLFSLKELVNMK